MTNDALAEAISRGGATLQDALSASLVVEQMIRHERCLGVDDLEKEHLAID